jgi:LuxR family maltose regulon positive regulatory protein
LSTVLYERNNLEGAAQSAQRAVDLSELVGLFEAQINAHYCLAQKLLVQGDVSGAMAEMQKVERAALHPSVSLFFEATHLAHHVMFAIQQDDLSAALDWGNRLLKYPDDILEVWEQHVPGRLLIARGERGAAAEYFRSLHAKAVKAGAQGYAIKIRVYQSLAADTPDEALAFLSDALTSGEPEGFIRTFVDEGKLLKPLLHKALAQGTAPEYTAKLLSIIESEDRIRRTHRGADSSDVPSGILSERETEILRLVAAGLSNGQIADKLYISPGTAKRHVHNIFEKLNTGDRLHTVTRARELKLI